MSGLSKSFAMILFAGLLIPAAGGFAQQPVPVEAVSQFSAETFGDLNYRLLTPKGFSPGTSGGATDAAPDDATDGEKYPLVVFLHGSGERGDDNTAQLTHAAIEFLRPDRRDAFPAFVVFPQCPKDGRWVETPWDLKSGFKAFPEAPSEPMADVLDLVDDLVQRYPVDGNRVYVAGLSMGGQGAWFAAAMKPKSFAAMIAVCGGGDPSWADRYAGIPVWVFHGSADTAVPVRRGREMIVALTNHGHHPEIRYTEYPGVEHDSWTQTFQRDDVFEWLFKQRKSPE